ncbi:MAG: AgmX/PglI C-terminal domain-containing protein [bacterium]|nr:MAG: AgmX/PglI C-terminal domain-containing protein [bacterium]
METTFKQKKFDSFLMKNVYTSEDFPILWQFPKEFKRNWFKQLDPRFMIILVSTFILEVCIILFLLSWIKGKDKMIDVNSIQKRYAHLLLDKFVDTDFSLDSTEPNGTYLYGVPEENKNLSTSFANQENLVQNTEDNPLNHYSINSKDVGSINSNNNEPYAGQTSISRTSNSYRSGSRESIGTLGLLHYLSEDNNNLANEELHEILTHSDRNHHYLESSLTNVKITNFKQQREPKELNIKAAMFSNGLKGSTNNVSTAEVLSSFTPLERANYSTVAKNTELEEFSASSLNKTGSKASARKAEHVTRVVLAHNRAIQDCYKQALKKHPALKGKVVVRFSVTPDGGVDLVKVIKSTIDYEPMLTCIVNRIRRWNDFGESDPSLGTVSYRQTYVFGY